MALDLTKPHSVHTDQSRITTYDQSGVLYDSVTLLELEGELDELAKTYVIPTDGKGALLGSVSKKRTEKERWEDAINTMIASNTLSGEDAGKLRAMVAKGLEEE